MQARQLADREGLRSFVVVFDKGDEAASGLATFAREHVVNGASLTAIGAVRSATLAYFDPEALDYRDIPVDGQCEVLSLIGDFALPPRGSASQQPVLHAHTVLGRRDGSTVGGHLKRAIVWPTLEVMVHETPAHLRKRSDPDTGLALLDPEAI